MINLQILNKIALKKVSEYTDLEMLDATINAPYAKNIVKPALLETMKQNNFNEEVIERLHVLYKNRKVYFGWGRGKTTPSELKKYTLKFLNYYGYDTSNITPRGLKTFMQMYNLGIDCSGFVYYVLDKTLQSVNISLAKELNLQYEKTPITKANTSKFNNVSIKIQPKDIRPLDLIFIQDDSQTVYHMGLILFYDDIPYVAQSSPFTIPSGVTSFPLQIINNLPKFKINLTFGTPFENLYTQNKIFFARLRILD